MRQSRRVRLRARLRTAGAALAATFRLRNLRRARRSVAYGAREYLCFYLAMLIIGTGFFVIALGADAELEHTRRQITDNYDYHIEIGGMTQEQMTALKKKLEKISGKTVKLTQKTDPSVLAGLRVELEGKQLDGTVKSRLDGLSRKLNELIV